MEEEIKKLNELDKKRTQGSWEFVTSSEDGEEVSAVKTTSTTGKTLTICNDRNYYPDPVSEADSRFIAEAPRMLELINQMHHQINALELINQIYRQLNENKPV